MDLNERIEAGRNNDVAVSFRTAAEMIDKVESGEMPVAIDPEGNAVYPFDVTKAPSNSDIGRRNSAKLRQENSRREDVRIATEFAKAAYEGASSVKALLAALNSPADGRPPIPARRGGEWTRSLVSMELANMGISIKALRKYMHDPLHDLPEDKAIRLVAGASINNKEKIVLVDRSKKTLWKIRRAKPDRKKGNQTVVINVLPDLEDNAPSEPEQNKPELKVKAPLKKLSEEAFWKIVEEEKQVVEKYGEWISILKHRPRSGDIVRHSDHGIGAFVDDESALLCRFWLENREALLKVEPVKTDVFTWGTSIGKARREFERIRRRYAIDSAYVDVRSITREQRLARYRAVRWRV